MSGETRTSTRSRKSQDGMAVLVVGPSGAGKDTLLSGARNALADQQIFTFPRRAITRASNPAHEAHDTLSRAQFDALVAAGDYCLSWEAHGHGYIIPASVDHEIRKGKVAIFNASRAVVAQAIERFHHVGIIQITASTSLLAKRIAARGRETATDTEKRLERASADIQADIAPITVVNDGSINDGITALVDAIFRLATSRAADLAP